MDNIDRVSGLKDVTNRVPQGFVWDQSCLKIALLLTQKNRRITTKCTHISKLVDHKQKGGF